MIIDGHSHTCGKYLTVAGIIDTLHKNGVDKVVLVPEELNSKTEYSLPNIASRFPENNVVCRTNNLTKYTIKLTGKVKDIPEGNEFVYQLKAEKDTKIKYEKALKALIIQPTNHSWELSFSSINPLLLKLKFNNYLL